MRGTGSREYTLNDCQVPTTHTISWNEWGEYRGESTGLPTQLLFAAGFGSVGLGIARRAMDSFIDLARGKTPVFANKKLLEDEMVQVGVAQAEAAWRSTRAFLLETAQECAHVHQAGGLPGRDLRTRLRLASTHAMRRSGDVVDQVYAMAGSDSIFDDHPLQRCFQDVHALTQQAQARPAHYRTVGRVLLGLEPGSVRVPPTPPGLGRT